MTNIRVTPVTFQKCKTFKKKNVKERKSMSYRIIIAGGRTFNDYQTAKNEITKIITALPGIDTGMKDIEIISGCAKGADTLGIKYAAENNIKMTPFPADWKNLGRKAGMIRNGQMLDYATKPKHKGVLIAFWDGQSHGTKNIIERCQKVKNMTVHVIMYNTKTTT